MCPARGSKPETILGDHDGISVSRVLACGSAAVVLAFGACSAAMARDLVIALKTEPSSMDPQYHALTPNTQISQTIFDTLVATDAQLKPVPALAESWTVDGKVWTFAASRREVLGRYSLHRRGRGLHL